MDYMFEKEEGGIRGHIKKAWEKRKAARRERSYEKAQYKEAHDRYYQEEKKRAMENMARKRAREKAHRDVERSYGPSGGLVAGMKSSIVTAGRYYEGFGRATGAIPKRHKTKKHRKKHRKSTGSYSTGAYGYSIFDI